MKLKLGLFIATCIASLSFTMNNEINWTAIKWANKMEGNFEFKNEWSYPNGVYLNKFGQLSCDGICPPEIDRMKDDKGKIYLDSLQAFYEVVDTTHLFHSIKSEAWTYEWTGTNFITFKKQTDNTIIGQTACNISTHSSLNIKIKNDSVTAWIDYNSIREGTGKHIFPMKKGLIRIDKQLFAQGIIKAEFDMTFENTLDIDEKMFWKGMIYNKIEK